MVNMVYTVNVRNAEQNNINSIIKAIKIKQQNNKNSIVMIIKIRQQNIRNSIIRTTKIKYQNDRNNIIRTIKKKQYYKDNKDKIKQYYKDNKDTILEYQKQHYEDNKDTILERKRQYNKQYCATPQGQVVAFNKSCKRRIKEQNQGSGISKDQWLEMMKYFDWKCAYSGNPLKNDTRTIDHIKPLNQGGEHEIWNLVPMYKNYNSSKKDKDLLEWYKEQPFFSEERLQKIYEWQEYAYNKWHKNEIVK